MDDCIETTHSKTKSGYGVIYFEKKYRREHRVVYCQFNAVTLEDIDGLVVRHKCDNRSCVNPKHLEIGTTQDNIDDRQSRGRGPKHERNGRSKLSFADVESIRNEYVWQSQEFGMVALARKYSVSSGQISKIIKHQGWK